MKFSLTLLISMLAIWSSPAAALDFSDHFSGAMRIDGESTWIFAEGIFEDGDAEKFERFLDGHPLWKNQRIVFNSGGGSVLEGIRIGQIIRRNGFRTAVSKSVKVGEYSEVQPGICASACVLAFAGGIERGASEGSKIGVHQMSRNYENIADGSEITVDDLKGNMSVTQLLLGLTLTHFIEMGIDPSILPLMVGTSPDDIKWLTDEEVHSTRIAFQPSQFSPWTIEGYGRGLVAYSRSLDNSKQLTLFCNAQGNMRFILNLQGSPYMDSYLADVNVQQFEVAGATVAAIDAEADVKDGALVISGPWNGSSEPGQYVSTFSLFGEAVGAISDIYSLYYFNKSQFLQSVELARKNCI